MRLQDRLEATIKARESTINKLRKENDRLHGKIDKIKEERDILMQELDSALELLYPKDRMTAAQILSDRKGK